MRSCDVLLMKVWEKILGKSVKAWDMYKQFRLKIKFFIKLQDYIQFDERFWVLEGSTRLDGQQMNLLLPLFNLPLPIKSYLGYKTITSQNVSSETQVKNFFIL